MQNSAIRIPALKIQQGDKAFFSFAIDGKLLPTFTAVSRISRDHQAQIVGYQRPEVLSHISEIRAYIESSGPLVPNSIIIAFDERVVFECGKSDIDGPSYVDVGELVIPVDSAWDDPEKPGWIVDGQQRTAAIREADVANFPVSVTAFVTSSLDEQRDQFILINNTKPLPKGLIYELLPNTSGRLPSYLQKRKFPAYLMERLNADEDSPFRGYIKTATVTDGLVKDNSILRMLENSLADGVLYRYRSPQLEEGSEPMLRTVKTYWSAVSEVFPEAWGLPPKRSRLMHGVGIQSLGHLMDAIADRHGIESPPSEEVFSRALHSLRDKCRWTHGYWEFGPGKTRKWNELQNTSKDIALLSNYLLVRYRQAVGWSGANSGSTNTAGGEQR